MKVPLFTREEWLEDKLNNYWSRGTRYERENGITTEGFDVVLDTPETIFLNQNKSDGTRTFIILFKKGTKNKYWDIWVPTKSQAEALASHDGFRAMYWATERHNNYIRGRASG